MTPLAPGATIGILGGGQLGRMLGVAAAQLGYRTHILAPEQEPVAAQTASAVTRAAYDDAEALAALARACDVVTYEFENVPVAAAERLAAQVPVHPHPRALAVAQDRAAEKRFVQGLGGRPAPWGEAGDDASFAAALTAVGTPAILKTTRFGYDGKGQARIDSPGEAAGALQAIGAPAVLERRIDFTHEFSILIVRGQDGAVVRYDAPRNEHVGGILRRSIVPGPPVADDQIASAAELAERIAERLGYVGLLACEFFATAEGPIFNEMAPRVHNSGHWTIEGAATSQFENHVRAICGLPLGATALRAPRVEMDNLIGDDVDRWRDLAAEPGAHLHLYGKGEARPGRKMGHVTRLRAR